MQSDDSNTVPMRGIATFSFDQVVFTAPIDAAWED
jgi:hypothetical protein